MAINLELKIEIDSIKSFEEKLKGIANHSGVLTQKDIYYKSKAGLLKLRVQDDSHQLIKYNRDETTEDRWSNYDILIMDGKNVEKYLADLFEIEVVVEKVRTLYMYKNTRIHLDEVKNLGEFLELESVVVETLDKAKSEFDQIVEILSLDLNKQLRMSYRDLLLAK